MGKDRENDDSRPSSRLEVACEPNGRIGAEPKLVDYPVSLGINVPEMYWMVSPGLVSMWTLHIRAGEVKVEGCEGLHCQDSVMACVPVKKRWMGEEDRSLVLWGNASNVLGADVHHAR